MPWQFGRWLRAQAAWKLPPRHFSQAAKTPMKRGGKKAIPNAGRQYRLNFFRLIFRKSITT
jgi:hypothetical protein